LSLDWIIIVYILCDDIILLIFLAISQYLECKDSKEMSIIKNYFKQNRVTHTFSSCQWPIGDPQEKDFHFCGSDPMEGKPYCETHCNVAYIDERELRKEKEAQKHRIAA